MPGRKYVRKGISAKEQAKKRQESWKARQASGRASAQSVVRRGNRRGQSAYSVSGSAIKNVASATLFPQGMKVPLVYAQDTTYSVVTAGNSTNAFAANSIFDPDITGTGHQPRFYDTLFGAAGTTAPYYSYRVHASKIEVNCRNTATSHMGVAITQAADIQITAPTSWNEAKERSNAICKVLTPVSSAGSLGKLVMYKSMQDMFPNSAYADFVAHYNANPSQLGRYYVQVFNLDSGATETVHCDVKITYYTECLTRNDPANS